MTQGKTFPKIKLRVGDNMKGVLARMERRQPKNNPSLFNEASSRPKHPAEQQRLEEQTLDLIKYYTYDTSLKDARYGILFNDSRCSIDFSEKKLIEILGFFAKLNNHVILPVTIHLFLGFLNLALRIS